MNGLDKIRKEIADEAAAEAGAILQEAQAQAEAIVAEAKAHAEGEAARLRREAQDGVRDIARAQSSAQALARRQRMLQTKQELLEDTLSAALGALYSLPDSEYFALVAKLAAANAEPGEGELLLNAKDAARLPADYTELLARALPAGAALRVGSHTRPIDGGCILKYGDIELNCSFRAIFDARAEEFKDKIQDILFPA